LDSGARHTRGVDASDWWRFVTRHVPSVINAWAANTSAKSQV
jgi:hypothetical protein